MLNLAFKPENESLLRKTLTTLGWWLTHANAVTGEYTIAADYAVVNIKNGMAVGRAEHVQTLRKTYAEQAVAQAMTYARQQGWNVQRKKNKLHVKKGR